MDKIVFLVVLSIYLLSYTARATPLKQQVIIFPDAVKEQIYSAITECGGGETKVKELMKIVQEGNRLEDDEFKTFIHCSFIKSGYASENGRVNVEKSAPLYPDPDVMLKVLKRCDEERGETPVDTTFAFFKCFQEKSPYRIGFA